MTKKSVKKEFQVPSDLSEVQKASAKILSFLSPLRLGEACEFDIRLCLEEALINAIKYGNLSDRRRKAVIEVEFDDRAARFRVTDEGPGFDIRRIGDCTHAENLTKAGGRGIYLMHKLMDEVRYNEKGNSVLMVKRLRKEPCSNPQSLRGSHGS